MPHCAGHSSGGGIQVLVLTCRDKDAVLAPPAVRPEAVEAGFLDADDADRGAAGALGLAALALQQGGGVAGGQRVAGEFRAFGLQDGDDPVLLAELKGDQDSRSLGGGGWLSVGIGSLPCKWKRSVQPVPISTRIGSCGADDAIFVTS